MRWPAADRLSASLYRACGLPTAASSPVLSDNRSTLAGCCSGRSVEVCGSERSISLSRPNRRSVATRRCARTSLTGSRPARSRPGSATRRPACIRWPASCAPAARSTSAPPSPGPARRARPTVCVTACSSYALWTARWRRSPPSWPSRERRCPRKRSGRSLTPRASSACRAVTGSERGAPPRLAAVKARALTRLAGRHAGRAAITPACSCSYPRSPSSASQTSSRPVATRQRRCSQRGTRSGRCCYTSARGPRAQATRTRSLMTPVSRC